MSTHISKEHKHYLKKDINWESRLKHSSSYQKNLELVKYYIFPMITSLTKTFHKTSLYNLNTLSLQKNSPKQEYTINYWTISFIFSPSIYKQKFNKDLNGLRALIPPQVDYRHLKKNENIGTNCVSFHD